MDSFNPTTKTQAALTSALQAATAAGNPEIRLANLLIALLTQNDGIAAPLLEAVGTYVITRDLDRTHGVLHPGDIRDALPLHRRRGVVPHRWHR